jgi:hypothetical protein
VIKRSILARILLLCLYIVAGAMDGLGPLQSASAQSSSLEYQVKAAFLFQFFKFVEWPQAALPAANQSICIGVLNGGPMTTALQSVEGKEIKGRRVVVRGFKKLEDLEFCHILFISSELEGRLAEILDRLKGTSTLTVSDIDGFARRGGMINFITVENKVQFEINAEAAERAKLQISSHLLRLARIVSGGR